MTIISIKEEYLIVDRWGTAYVGELCHELKPPVSINVARWCVMDFQSNGMLWWRSWDYSLAWWTMTGGMKHFLSAWVKTSKLHQNGARSPVCTFHIISPLKYLYVHTTLCHLPLGSNPISSQFHTWVALGWIWWRSGGTIFRTWKGYLSWLFAC